VEAVFSTEAARALAPDDFEEPEWERPTRLRGQVNASVGADQINAPEPRPLR
jgi:hypothetical protein